jgi:molybdopterin-guanine dinucleotide biosynthesis protein B
VTSSFPELKDAFGEMRVVASMGRWYNESKRTQEKRHVADPLADKGHDEFEHTIPIVSVVGRSGAGRTTLLEKLIPELKRRGYRVATVKHHAHPGFEVDTPGKDTWRHARAGSDQVVIAAPDRVAAISYVDHALTLDEIATTLIRDAAIILTEGFSQVGKPQIEVVQAAFSTQPMADPKRLLAVATDVALQLDVPQFDLDDASGLVDLIETRFLAS